MADVIALDENSMPKESSILRTPGSNKVLRRTLGSNKMGEQITPKSVKIGSVERSMYCTDDSLARVVNEDHLAGTPSGIDSPQQNVMQAWKPSNLKRLGHQNDIERLRSLEAENARLKEALKGLKAITEQQTQLVLSNAAIVEGARRYVTEKSSAQKITPLRRQHHVFTVRVQDWEVMDNSHIEYIIEVNATPETKYTIRKRYSEFLGLRQRLLTAAEQSARSESCFLFSQKAADEISTLTLQAMREAEMPKKMWFGNFSESALEARKEGLQDFLDQMIRAVKRAGRGAAVRGILSDWLGIHPEDEDTVWCDDRIRPLRDYDNRSRQARISEAFDTLLGGSPAVMKSVLSEQMPVAYSPASVGTMQAERDLELL